MTLSSDTLLKVRGPISSRTDTYVDGFSSHAYVVTSINSRPALWRCLQPRVNKDVCFCTAYYECRKCEFLLTDGTSKWRGDGALCMLCWTVVAITCTGALCMFCWTVVAITCTVPTASATLLKYFQVYFVPHSKHIDCALKITIF